MVCRDAVALLGAFHPNSLGENKLHEVNAHSALRGKVLDPFVKGETVRAFSSVWKSLPPAEKKLADLS